MAEIRGHVGEELADDQAVLILDATTFPKTGADSCVVGRQWCGRLGMQENCQRGIFPPTPPPAGMRRWTESFTCPRTGPATRHVVGSATSPRRSSSARAGGSPPS